MRYHWGMSSQPTWNLAQLVSDENELPRLRAEQKKAVQGFIARWQPNNQDWQVDSGRLRSCLDEAAELHHRYGTYGTEAYYWWLRYSQDQSDPEVKAAKHLSEEWSRELEDQLRPWYLALCQLPQPLQQQHLTDERLEPYHHFLTRAFRAGEHQLSADQELVASALSGPAHSRWSELTESLLVKETAPVEVDGTTKELTMVELISRCSDADPAVRADAGQALNQLFARYAEVAEPEMNALLAFKQADDRLRHYTSPEEARLLSDDMNTSTVEAMCQAVSSSYPISHRFYQLKARLLKQDQLAYYERNATLPSELPQYDYEAASRLVSEVFHQLDPEFAAIFQQLNEAGCVDISPRPGKDSGAFCAYNLPSDPTYILLNHTGELRDVLVLAHEMGHAINDELMKTARHALDFGTPPSTAEVASTFMEDFVLDRLLAEATPRNRLALLMQQLDEQVATIFRQVAFYRFEQELHRRFREKGHLSHEEIGQMFSQELTAYLGPAVKVDEMAANWWIYVGHFRYFFYVYSYASGQLISKALQSQVRRDPHAILKVKEFLRTGTSSSPAAAFSRLGLDITRPDFWSEGIQELERLVDEAEALARELDSSV